MQASFSQQGCEGLQIMMSSHPLATVSSPIQSCATRASIDVLLAPGELIRRPQGQLRPFRLDGVGKCRSIQ